MKKPLVLSIQDVSCLGQCSLTVALPIISACGFETAILPTAVLSTHTGGFTGFAVEDLTGFMPRALAHWQREGVKFDAICTGYLGSMEQIDITAEIFKSLLAPGGKIYVDPAMADNGKLYPAFDMDYALAMKKLCSMADVVLPNLTEAAFLTGHEYKERFDADETEELLRDLCDIGARATVITGVNDLKGMTGAAVMENGKVEYYRHERLDCAYHGTGDIYSAAFVGAALRGKSLLRSAAIAADYTVECIKNTVGDDGHWYGVHFEEKLPKLLELMDN